MMKFNLKRYSDEGVIGYNTLLDQFEHHTKCSKENGFFAACSILEDPAYIFIKDKETFRKYRRIQRLKLLK